MTATRARPVIAAALLAALLGGGSQQAGAGPAEQWCAGTFDTQRHVAGPLRYGVDTGIAGNPVPVGSVAASDKRKELAALRGLKPQGRPLVVRLNRLFWSEGERQLQEFAREASRLARHGFDVEVQVRYHPTAEQEGDIGAWRRWVRHVVDVLGKNRRLVSLTITNEVNLPISNNTSDGPYDGARDALIQGVTTAYDQLARHGWERRVKVGFTFAYRFSPQGDVEFWKYLKAHGGPRFLRALGFVGLDDYPGTFYPPVLLPGSPTGSEPGATLAEAAATMRRCYLPMAGIPASVPLWVTENGYPTRGGSLGEGEQRDALVDMVRATRAIARTYGVTDYRWFNLRDNDSAGVGMFDTCGLLRDDYSRKPSYDAMRRLIR